MFNYFKKIRDELNLDYTKFMITWVFCWTLLAITIKKSSWELKLNELWDAMWWIFWTLISTLVFVFVLKTYYLQKEELEKTTEALEGQEKVMNEQRFQDNFFRLIELFNQHRRRSVYKRIYESTLERFSFEDILPKLLDWITEAKLGSHTFPWSDFTRMYDAPEKEIQDSKDWTIDIYAHMMGRPDWKTTQSLILQYMQFISQIYRLISLSQLSQERKLDFQQILESTLSWEEKRLISIHEDSWLEPRIKK